MGRRSRRLSPPSLPPRWGEGVAPPSTVENSPSDSPQLLVSPDSEYRVRAATLPRVGHARLMTPDSEHSLQPSSGAELLADLHRRLSQQCTAQGSLPRRPKVSSLHRRPRRVRRSRRDEEKPGTLPDLLPTSAFNHPSRHTQYSVLQLARETREPTSDYSPSPSTSESPPLPHPSTSLSYPSPPIQRRHRSQPLTSTMLNSPGSLSSPSTCSPLQHPTSPASPEISTIPLRPADSTQYQNIEHGIVYIPARQAVNANTTNLSRFNVSPPGAPPALVRSGLRPPSSSSHRAKSKSVSWVADRKLQAKNISEDRKVVKTQVGGQKSHPGKLVLL